MIIGIDGNEANVSKRVGVSEYAYELLMRFKDLPDSSFQFQIYLKDQPLPHMPSQRKGFRYVIVKPHKFWTQLGLPFYLWTHFPRPDVFFSPNHYGPRFCPVKSVITIHDTSYLLYPEQFKKRDLYQLLSWTAYSVKQSKHIFAVSTATRNDIMNYYHMPENRVTTTRLGIRQTLPMNGSHTITELQKKYGFGENYIFFLGTIQPRKNLLRLIDAFNILLRKHKELDLVIVGRKGWLFDSIFARPKELGIEKYVHFLDFVGDEDVKVLYANAKVFAFPALYEGFGLPVLEAMQAGTPVVTSNTSSLPEVGGDAALYCDPLNTEDIAKKIDMVLSDPKRAKDMVKKGKENVKKFSWDKTAKETLEVLESVAKGK